MQKSRQIRTQAPVTPVAAVAPSPDRLSTQQAIYNLASRLKLLETTTSNHMKAVEHKIGDHENMFTSAPDMDQIADMFKAQNDKLDAMHVRLTDLEKKNGVKAPKSKSGTVKLLDLNIQEEDGISFDNEH
jgi:hypothetical protein